MNAKPEGLSSPLGVCREMGFARPARCLVVLRHPRFEHNFPKIVVLAGLFLLGSPTRGAAQQHAQGTSEIAPCAAGKPAKGGMRPVPKKWKLQPGEKFSNSPVISFAVSPSGKVDSIRLLKSSGVKDVDRWVVLSVKRWRYKSVRRCAPTELQMTVSVDF